MSDSVTNIAIEDVLSSIRRLVSEGDRPRRAEGLSALAQPDRPQVAPAVPLAAANNPYLVDRFVLTPALRVTGRTLPIAEPTTAAKTLTLVETIAPVVARLPDPPQIWADQAAVTAEPAAESRSKLELRIAELEAAVTRQDDDWEPDGSEETPVVDWANTPPETLMFASRAHPALTPLDLGTMARRITPLVDVGADAAQPEPVEELVFAGFRDVRSGPDDDMLGSADLADETLLDREFLGELAEDLPVYQDDTGLIDEETLRRLVIDIVRQELQGPMGERITRNVRKLVRREIYRVLASQEFE